MNKNIITYTIPILASFGALTAAVWGKGQAARAEEYSRLADEYVGVCVNSCARCAEELSGSVDEMNTSLSKLRITASREGQVLALEDIVRESSTAAALVSRLPQSQIDVMELSGFLTRTGDYARTLSKKLLAGGELESLDREQLAAMLDSCSGLNDLIAARIASGEMPVGTEDFDYYDEAPKSNDESSDEPSEPEYPTLIYDGPFSESTEKLEPIGVTGGQATPEQAETRARELFGEGFVFEGETQGRLPTFDFSNGDGTASLSLTCRGLHPIRFMKTPSGDMSGLPSDEEYSKLISKAGDFLSSMGYDSMTPTFSQYYDGAALISFVWEHDGVLVYPDLVKVWIDRQTQEPIGLDARNYLFSHRERDLGAPAITKEQAVLSVSNELGAECSGLALIPLTPQTETLCYEFWGSFGGTDYVVYVNAATGREEQIFMIINDDNGKKAV